MDRGFRLFASPLRILLSAIAAAAGSLILVRALAGPFGPVHNPIALECTVAVATFLALLLARPAAELPTGAGSPNWLMAVVLIEVGVAYGSVLSMPLVTDDYIQIQQIATNAAPMPIGLFTHVGAGSQFYRPIAYLTYWAESALWGNAAMPRHALDLVLHAASSLLFFRLVRRLGVPRPFDIFAALAFTWHGIRPEVVAWSAGRADALVLLFSLIAAHFVLRRTTLTFAAALLAVVIACMSKESAFALPLLLAPLVWTAHEDRRLVIRNIAAIFLVTAAMFALRLWTLHGVGGYFDDVGAPKALNLNPLIFVKTFGARIWGILWFPLNWTRPLEWWMKLAFLGGTAASIIMLKARPDARRLAVAIGCIAAACLPAHHLLLIDASLERSRYLTLASVPFVIALVFIWMALPRKLGILAATLVVTFQVAAVDHNLKIWRAVAKDRLEACRQVADLAKKTEASIAITGMPLLVDGAYWSNGFEECLWQNFGIPLGRVRVNGSPPTNNELELRWAEFRKLTTP